MEQNRDKVRNSTIDIEEDLHEAMYVEHHNNDPIIPGIDIKFSPQTTPPAQIAITHGGETSEGVWKKNVEYTCECGKTVEFLVSYNPKPEEIKVKKEEKFYEVKAEENCEVKTEEEEEYNEVEYEENCEIEKEEEDDSQSD